MHNSRRGPKVREKAQRWDLSSKDFRFWLILFFTVSMVLAHYGKAEVPNCECPKLECDPCFEEQGVTFYSEKCGPNLARIKSCAKPTCVPMEPKPAQCQSVSAAQPQRTIASQSVENSPASKKMMDRRMAEFKSEMRGKEVGAIHTVMGEAIIRLPSGEEMKVVKGTRVHEKDTIKTRNRGHVKILFDDGNVANIKPASEVIVQEYSMGKDKRALLNLIKGKVRSKVKQKYEGSETSYFKVRTKSAVAGVRGTDFVVEYSENERLITKVSTLEGKVDFGGQEYKERVGINAGQQAAFIVASNDSEVFSDEEISDFVAKGYMTPVYNLSSAEIEQLNRVTEVGDPVERNIASTKASSICSSPKGELNQCAWTCKNNPKGASRCRTDLPQVNCVRTKCDGNGQWSDESRLPASFYDSCQPSGYKVGPCDY